MPHHKPEPTETPISIAQTSVNDDMVNFYWQVRKLPAPELQKKLSELNAQLDSPRRHLQKAMIFGLMRGTVDVNRAITLLDNILKSDDASALACKPLASLLLANYLEWRRMDDLLDKQGQQLKDAQHRADTLNQKLDELKNVEQLLPTRPRNNESHESHESRQ